MTVIADSLTSVGNIRVIVVASFKMVRLVFFCVFLAIFGSNQCEDVETLQGDIEVVVVKNLTEFLRSEPEFVVEPLTRDFGNLAQIRYTLGNRISGESLTARNFAIA